MKTSDTIADLAAALSKAQASIQGATKDASNPFFKSRYADLGAVWEAIRGPLTTHGLAIVQGVSTGENSQIVVTTRLLHASGQWIEDTLTLNPKATDPQGMGSAITYGRRYALAAITSCPQIDDDGESAMGRTHDTRNDPRGEAYRQVPPLAVRAAVDRVDRLLKEDLDENTQALRLFDLHCEFNKDPDLYIAIGDALAEQKVVSKGDWRKVVNLGKKLAERPIQ